MAKSGKYRAITESGRGVVIADQQLLDFSVDEIRRLIAEYQWLAFRNQNINTDQATTFLEKFGTLTRNDRRQDAVLKLDGSKKDEVLLGQGFMPLHRDGALMGNRIEMVGIFCVTLSNVKDGRTFITDIESATARFPKDIVELVRERGVEARPVDKYYTSAADVWHKIPGFIEVDGKSFLNVGFPYRPGEKASWLVRIPGLSEEKSQEAFEVMRKIAMDEQYCYYHEWHKPGDILLLDNMRTLHGREAYEGERSLANIQVLAKSA